VFGGAGRPDALGDTGHRLSPAVPTCSATPTDGDGFNGSSESEQQLRTGAMGWHHLTVCKHWADRCSF